MLIETRSKKSFGVVSPLGFFLNETRAASIRALSMDLNGLSLELPLFVFESDARGALASTYNLLWFLPPNFSAQISKSLFVTCSTSGEIGKETHPSALPVGFIEKLFSGRLYLSDPGLNCSTILLLEGYI